MKAHYLFLERCSAVPNLQDYHTPQDSSTVPWRPCPSPASPATRSFSRCTESKKGFRDSIELPPAKLPKGLPHRLFTQRGTERGCGMAGGRGLHGVVEREMRTKRPGWLVLLADGLKRCCWKGKVLRHRCSPSHLSARVFSGFYIFFLNLLFRL